VLRRLGTGEEKLKRKPSKAEKRELKTKGNKKL